METFVMHFQILPKSLAVFVCIILYVHIHVHVHEQVQVQILSDHCVF